MKKIPAEIVKRLADTQHELVSLSLAVTGHDELWGALRVAKTGVEQCVQIAHRDIDQKTVAQLRERRR